jgi:hypothetical protein
VKAFVALSFAGAALLLGSAASSAEVQRLSFSAPQLVDPGPAGAFDAEAIAIGDLNGDGRPDLAGVSDADSAVWVAFGRGSGRFRAEVEYPAGDIPGPILVGDLNGDGRPDLVTANVDPASKTISVLLNRGDGTFAPHVEYPTGGIPYAAALGDLNGDDRPDVVTANYEAKSVSVFLNRGDGSFVPKVDHRTGAKPVGVATGDLNGDGKQDLLTANEGDGTVSVLLGRGDGTFLPRHDIASGGNPDSIALADLDGNGSLDVAVTNAVRPGQHPAAHGVSVFPNTGDGTLGPRRDYGRREPAERIQAVDLNGDGKPDLAFTAPLGAPFGPAVRLNRGDGAFGPALAYSLPGALGGDSALAFGDLNGDGKRDLVASTAGSQPNEEWSLFVRLNRPGLCNVQPVVGITTAAARRALARVNCRVGAVEHAYSTKLKRGRVISQAPAAGAVRRGRANIRLVVSLGR